MNAPYLNSDGKWCLTCSVCGKERPQSKRKTALLALRMGSMRCKVCANVGENNPQYGISPSNLGIPLTKKTKKKLSIAATGRRGHWNGKKFSEEHRRKLRLNVCKRLLKMKTLKVDVGASDFFNKLNAIGYNICHPNIYVDGMGYFVDGYDPVRHTIWEFDTKYHRPHSQQLKDKQRQEEIEQHFIKLGKPVKFVRVQAY